MKWKQAIAFFFTHGTIATSKLSVLITECIAKLHAIGLFTRCIVCDQGPTNVAAIGVLGATTNSPYFVVDGLDHPVHVVYD